MRRLFIAVLLFQFFAEAFAQAPERMSYQAVVRRTNNQLVNEETVGMQISILQGSATGAAVFVETHTPETDRNGVVSIEIGGGTISAGTIAAIDWSSGPYFIQTEIDLNGGTNYTITGTSQLLTVPFAKLADSADKLTNGEQDPLFQSSVARGITGADTAKWNTNSTGLDSAGVAAFGYVAGPKTVDTQIDSAGIASLGFVAGDKTVDTTLDSAAIAALGYVAGPKTVDTQIDSMGIATFGYVAGPHTPQIDSLGIVALGFVAGEFPEVSALDSADIADFGYVAGEHTVDTQIDSTGIAALGYVAGPKTVDTQIDSVGIATLGYVAGPHIEQIDSLGIVALGFVAGEFPEVSALDSADIADFGYVAGEHTVDTQIDSTGIVALGFVAGAKTVDTTLDSTAIAALGYVAGPHTVDTTLDSAAIAALGFVANPALFTTNDETDPIFAASPAGTITNTDLANWNAASGNNLDNDPNNEIQALSYANGTLTLSKGGGSVNLSLITTGFWATAPLHPGTGGTPPTQPCALVCPDGFSAGANDKGNNCRTDTGSEGRIIKASSTTYFCGNGRLALCFCVKTN